MLLQGGINRGSADQMPFFAGVAGLLQQFALYGHERLFTCIVDHAGREFGSCLSDGMAVLLDQDDVEFVRQRDHIDPVRVLENVTGREDPAARQQHGIAAQAKPRIGESVSQLEHLPCSWRAAGSGAALPGHHLPAGPEVEHVGHVGEFFCRKRAP